MRFAWCWSLAAALAWACGNVANSPHPTPDTSDGGDPNENAPTAGKVAAFGGTSHSNGGTGAGSGAGGIVLSTAGTSTGTPNHPDFGGTGGGGEPTSFGEASLCIYPEDIPANWGAEVVTDDNGHACPVGVLGSFFFMDCPYELLDVTPHDVDPFAPGHSHCCYKSRLRPCR